MAFVDLADDLSAARAGSRDALGRILDTCRRYLLQVAHGEMGTALTAKGGASDLVQDTFLQAQRVFNRFQGETEADLRAWLRSLLHNQAAHMGRRYRGTQKRRLAREVSLTSAEDVRLSALGPSPSDAAAADEQLRGLTQALARLPEEYRQVMALRYEQGLPFDEVGRLLGRSPDAARMLWVRAVERLKLELTASHDSR